MVFEVLVVVILMLVILSLIVYFITSRINQKTKNKKTIPESHPLYPTNNLISTDIDPPDKDTISENSSETEETNEPDEQTLTPQNKEIIDKKDNKPSNHKRAIIPVEKRGPRRPEFIEKKEKLDISKRSYPKPEIVCWKREREWYIGVEISEDLVDVADINVLQDEVPLLEDTLYKHHWKLNNLYGKIDVRTPNEYICIVGSECYLLFKLSGSDFSHGRHVKIPYIGSYLAIVPEGWQRNEELAGMAPSAPEPVCIDGCRAHYFDLLENENINIAFKDSMGQSINITNNESQFRFLGNELHDASEHFGPLFIGCPPQLSIVNGNWKDIAIVVVGEEGSGIGQWRKSFKPNSTVTEQTMPNEITKEIAIRKAGWFFVRFYNLDEQLIDSMDFRFITGLNRITIKDSQLFPIETGHKQAIIEFEHNKGYCFKPLGISLEMLAIEQHNEKTIAVIPSDAFYDHTKWSVGLSDKNRVTIEILVKRIWWNLAEGNEPPSQWQDRCLQLSTKDFKATTVQTIWIRLPKCRYTNFIAVGFQRTTSREFTLKVNENMLAIPLRDFSDSQEVATYNDTNFLTVWLEDNGVEYECHIACLKAKDTQKKRSKLEPIPITWDVKLYLDCLLKKTYFIPDLKSSLIRLARDKNTPMHCRDDIFQWSSQLFKQNPNHDLIWKSFCAVDRYLYPKPKCTNWIPMPEAARKDIINAQKKLDQWWSDS